MGYWGTVVVLQTGYIVVAVIRSTIKSILQWNLSALRDFEMQSRRIKLSSSSSTPYLAMMIMLDDEDYHHRKPPYTKVSAILKNIQHNIQYAFTRPIFDAKAKANRTQASNLRGVWSAQTIGDLRRKFVLRHRDLLTSFENLATRLTSPRHAACHWVAGYRDVNIDTSRGRIFSVPSRASADLPIPCTFDYVSTPIAY